ncbi:fluoride efflux transporter CrcB [Desulfovibrio sp. OttesenSCG-928-F07]|nr:fluoride efflux transporter CrcB [Desulfovibrio sp. OttesenSCG-928-F07]
MLKAILCISAGASTGATLRWLVGQWLNQHSNIITLGTLAVNVSGGFLAGIALGVFRYLPQISIEWRLLCITGFLGAFTTFSAFSTEIVQQLEQGYYLTAAATIGLHVAGSIIATLLGFGCFTLIAQLLR